MSSGILLAADVTGAVKAAGNVLVKGATSALHMAKGVSGFAQSQFGDLSTRCEPQGADFTVLSTLPPRVEKNLELCKNIIGQLSLPELQAALDAVLQNAKESILRVVVAGRFNTGKSTLINSLIAREIFPKGNLPTTKILCWLLHGKQNMLLCETKDGEILEFPLETMTLTPVEGGIVNATKLYASIDTPILLPCVAIIDTPGLNDPDEAMTQLSMEAMAEADVVIYVMDHYPAASCDRRALAHLATHGKKELLLVVNKIDQIPEGEVQDILDERLQTLNGMGLSAQIFPLSAENGAHLLPFQQFRAGLIEFLSTSMKKSRINLLESQLRSVMLKTSEACSYIEGLSHLSEASLQEAQRKAERLEHYFESRIRRAEAEVDAVGSRILVNWRLHLHTMQSDFDQKINTATCNDLQHRDFIENFVLNSTLTFLQTEFATACVDMEKWTKQAMDERIDPLPGMEQEFSLGVAQHGRLSALPQELCSAGLLVASFPLMGFFSWVPFAIAIVVGRPLVDNLFGAVTKHMEVNSMRKQLRDVLEGQWPQLDAKVQEKIAESVFKFKEHVKMVLSSERNAMLEALTNAASPQKSEPMDPQQLRQWAISLKKGIASC